MAGGGKKKQETKVDIPDYAKPYMTQALTDSKNLYASGQLAPKLTRSSETLKGQQMTLSLADYLQGTAIPEYEASINDLRNSNLVGSKQTQDVINSSTRPIMEQLNRYAIPQTQDMAVSAGQRGSSRQGIAEGLARSDANNQMGDIASKISFSAMQEDVNNKRLSTQLMPQLLQMLGLPASLVSGVGTANDTFENANANSASQNLQMYANLIKMFTPQMNSSTTTSQSSSPLGTLMALGGTAGSLMGGWGGLLAGQAAKTTAGAP